MNERRSILITGACGDIGAALAAEFAASGPANLALCDLVASDAAEAMIARLRQSGATVLYREVDVTDQSAMTEFIAAAEAEFGGVDVCIGNAGIVERGGVLDLTLEQWRRTIEVNLTGCFITGQEAARSMRRTKRPGHIVFLSSWTQDLPREGISAYCVSKGGLKMLAKCMALELGRHGIRVNLVAPGFVDAGLTAKNLAKNPHRRPVMEAEIPLGNLISAQDLARTIRMLCSDDAAYITGATLLVDGGSSLNYRSQ